MGNSCCTNDSKTESIPFTFTTQERKKLISNMTQMGEDPSLAQNAPKSSHAILTDSMNEMNKIVKDVYDREGIPPISKSSYSVKFDKYPFLGPFKYTDGSSYEG